jgi:hypothetical protein
MSSCVHGVSLASDGVCEHCLAWKELRKERSRVLRHIQALPESSALQQMKLARLEDRMEELNRLRSVTVNELSELQGEGRGKRFLRRLLQLN